MTAQRVPQAELVPVKASLPLALPEALLHGHFFPETLIRRDKDTGPLSGQPGLGMAGQEPLGIRLADQAIVDEPFHGAALGAGVTEGVPGRQ